MEQQEPPVYNINKSDFRDIVQKLTGSPVHDRFSTPPPIHPPKPPSSRLQRIRPPPLAHLGIRLTPSPPPLINDAVPLQFPSSAVVNPNNPIHAGSAAAVASARMTNSQRPVQPLSPLPPLPTVHAAAESPISAYMRSSRAPCRPSISIPSDYRHSRLTLGFPQICSFLPLPRPSWGFSSSLCHLRYPCPALDGKIYENLPYTVNSSEIKDLFPMLIKDM